MQNVELFWISEKKSADIQQVLQIVVAITWHNCHQTQPSLLNHYQLLVTAGSARHARPAGRRSSQLLSVDTQAFWRCHMPKCQVGDKDDLPCQEDRAASQEPASIEHILSVFMFRELVGYCVNFVSCLWNSRKKVTFPPVNGEGWE